MSCGDLELEEVNVGDVQRLRFTITKDSIVWNLIAGSVVLKFRRPTGTTFSRSMTAESAVDGIFYYDTVTTDLDVAGTWLLSLVVTDGPIVKTYPHEISMEVVDMPSGNPED